MEIVQIFNFQLYIKYRLDLIMLSVKVKDLLDLLNELICWLISGLEDWEEKSRER